MQRNVRLCTVPLMVDRVQQMEVPPQDRIQRLCEELIQTVQATGKEKPDLVVCPEEFAFLGLSPAQKYQLGECIPDKNAYIQSAMADCARGINAHVVYGTSETDGDRRYNTAVLINRNGQYVGKYRKTHLVPGEDPYTVPGDEYPVFQLDNFRLGITLCMDIHYPEMWRILALQGADVIAHPTGWMDYTGNLCESLVNARAIDNQYYVVTSHFVEMPYLSGRLPGHSRIVDPYGRTRADTGHIPGYAVCEVDLDQGYEYWVGGELKKNFPTLKECFFQRRRPETYSRICEPTGTTWRITEPTIRKPE